MSELHYVFRFLNKRLAKWVSNKYRRFRGKHWFFAYKWLQETAKQYPNMFVHWAKRGLCLRTAKGRPGLL